MNSPWIDLEDNITFEIYWCELLSKQLQRKN